LPVVSRVIKSGTRPILLEEHMSRISRLLTAATVVTAFAASPAFAQSQTQRVAGKIAGVEGSTVVVKQANGNEVRVNLTSNAVVMTVGKATLADIKANSYIGVGAMPQADGSQKAIRVMIFPEMQRGTGEGHGPWDRPGTTMTNATVDTTVASVEGQVVTVKYKDGEKKILIGPDAIILSNIPGSRSDLHPDANINIPAATKKADGTLEAARVNIGRGDYVP
jgi:ABC-type Fe3+-hydroxamate transport system substrate-binding protein